MNGILALRWKKNPTFPFLLLPFLLLRGQIWAPKIRARETGRFKPHLLLSIPAGVQQKSCARCFFFKLKEKKKHAKTRENSTFVKHYLWVSLVFQEIHRNTRNHKDMFLTYPALSEHPKLSTHQCDWLNGLSWLTSWESEHPHHDFSVWRTSTNRISLKKIMQGLDSDEC